jgi:replicative DNA helicase
VSELPGIPKAVDAERAVLGTMIDNRGFLVDGVEFLEAEDFTSVHTRTVFHAMERLRDRGDLVDLPVTVEEVRSMGKLDLVGGAGFIGDLTKDAYSVATVYVGIRAIKTARSRRAIVALCRDAGKNAAESTIEPAEIIETLTAGLVEIGSHRVRGLVPASSVLAEVLAEAADPSLAQRGTVRSGLRDLDNLLGSFVPGSLVVIGGRPSMGKSALLDGISIEVSCRGAAPVALFSLEMPIKDVLRRVLAQMSGANLQRLMEAKLRPEELRAVREAARLLGDSPLYISDLASPMLRDIRLHASRLKMSGHVGLIVVDYIQLMRATKCQNREQEISSLSRGLKAIAKDLDVPILVGSQLSREAKFGVRPELSHLRESGAIEQDADIVCFLHEPGKPQANRQQPREMLLIVAKNRNGPTGDIKLTFEPTCARFTSRAPGLVERSQSAA